MKPKRVAISSKLKKLLQKEIKSQCPFCNSQDIATFQHHHINGDRSESTFSNLIMLCPTCHVKIEQGDIAADKVVLKKKDLLRVRPSVEFVAVVADTKNCNWQGSVENENAFFKRKGAKSEYPILRFTFINHSAKTIVLKRIDARLKELPRGISGHLPKPQVLKSLVKYSLTLKAGRQHKFSLLNPLMIPEKEGFMFRIQFSIFDSPGKVSTVTGRAVVFLKFIFSDDITLEIPTLCFNCNSENEQMKIYIVG